MPLGRTSHAIVIGTRGRPSLIYAFNLYALGELKHVVCMFFSVNNPQFKRHPPDLVKICSEPQRRNFPAYARIYAFSTFSDRPARYDRNTIAHSRNNSVARPGHRLARYTNALTRSMNPVHG